jgi:acetyl esterase/lipase
MSLRARLVRLGVRAFVRRGDHEWSVGEWRRGLDAMERMIPQPPGGTRTARVDAGGRPAIHIARPASRPDSHVLYLHGGGYISGSPDHYRHFTWRLADATRANIWALAYRLAPEHPVPAGLDDALAAYRWRLANGADPRSLAVIGDSAGGGLALALLLKLRDLGEPLPAVAVAMSPWTDLTLASPSIQANERLDPMLNARDLPHLVPLYAGSADPRIPYMSPVFGDTTGLPPTLIQVGSDEILRDDAVRMADRYRANGASVELEVWPAMPHVWHLFAPVLPEARQAIERIGDFVQHAFEAAALSRDWRSSQVRGQSRAG